MAKEIIDIYIEKGYPYPFDIDFNTEDGLDLESEYTCWFENKDIGLKQFSVIDNTFKLILTQEDTGKLESNLEDYVVYAQKISTSEYEKLLSGRIIIDEKVRSI